MIFWSIFWTAFLIISIALFTVLSIIVTWKGFKELLNYFKK